MLSGEAAYVKFHSAWFDQTGDSRSRSTTLVVSTLTIEPQLQLGDTDLHMLRIITFDIQ
jgi:hypothetical protein